MIRRARTGDVVAIQKLINTYAATGVMLPRSRVQLYVALRDFMIAEEDGQVVGCCALSLSWEDLAEIRSLAVAESYRGRGLGEALFAACVHEARELGIHRVFALTTSPDYFRRCGFSLCDKKELPHKIWNECINCPKFPDDCDETAVVLALPDAPTDLPDTDGGIDEH